MYGALINHSYRQQLTDLNLKENCVILLNESGTGNDTRWKNKIFTVASTVVVVEFRIQFFIFL